MAFKPSGKLIFAGLLAGVTDLIQAALPLSSWGFLNPINDVIYLVMGAIMVSIFGWHWAFMPSFIGKLVPGIDLCPSWTMAVFIVGWGEHAEEARKQGHPVQAPPMPFMMPGFTPGQPPQKELVINATQPQTSQNPH